MAETLDIELALERYVGEKKARAIALAIREGLANAGLDDFEGQPHWVMGCILDELKTVELLEGRRFAGGGS